MDCPKLYQMELEQIIYLGGRRGGSGKECVCGGTKRVQGESLIGSNIPEQRKV